MDTQDSLDTRLVQLARGEKRLESTVNLPVHRASTVVYPDLAHYLRRNDGYVYPSYGAIFGQYFLKAKDPIAHPLWQDPER